MKKTQKLRKLSHTIDHRTIHSKNKNSPIMFGTVAQTNETLKNSVFPSEMRTLFPPDMGLNFSDEIAE
jgi:hypothetical protein